MADVATTTGTDGPEGETPTQRQARMRREKRQKKMAEQGEDRLAKIKALNGGIAPPDEVLGGPPAPTVADDPDEVDISTLSSNTSATNQNSNPQNNPLAAAMAQMEQERRAQGGSNGQEDPMMKMMQQMMGSMGAVPNDPNAKPPAWMTSMMNASQNKEEPKGPATGSAYLWRIVHAIFAFILASYICLTSTFNGSKLSRNESVYSDEAGYGLGPRLFIIFTSAELVLQSTRYFLEKGQLQGPGIFSTVANSGFVPEPYANYVRIAGRYIGIAQTIFSDVMVIVFVLGCMAWWNGAATAAY